MVNDGDSDKVPGIDGVMLVTSLSLSTDIDDDTAICCGIVVFSVACVFEDVKDAKFTDNSFPLPTIVTS